ncbi:hypothetical protein DPV78_008407 [Talaromyces pinophilus]|nr:hypothetical protein DPV78_008407 [Talaromyces pinophilus]
MSDIRDLTLNRVKKHRDHKTQFKKPRNTTLIIVRLQWECVPNRKLPEHQRTAVILRMCTVSIDVRHRGIRIQLAPEAELTSMDGQNHGCKASAMPQQCRWIVWSHVTTKLDSAKIRRWRGGRKPHWRMTA